MSAVTAGSPHNSIARGRSSICHDRATRRSVLNFSVSVMIAAENGPIPALHSDPAQVGPGVRIHLPPAVSQQRTGTWALSPISITLHPSEEAVAGVQMESKRGLFDRPHHAPTIEPTGNRVIRFLPPWLVRLRAAPPRLSDPDDD